MYCVDILCVVVEGWGKKQPDFRYPVLRTCQYMLYFVG